LCDATREMCPSRVTVLYVGLHVQRELEGVYSSTVGRIATAAADHRRTPNSKSNSDVYPLPSKLPSSAGGSCISANTFFFRQTIRIHIHIRIYSGSDQNTRCPSFPERSGAIREPYIICFSQHLINVSSPSPVLTCDLRCYEYYQPPLLFSTMTELVISRALCACPEYARRLCHLPG
jgi:hypothetical protein